MSEEQTDATEETFAEDDLRKSLTQDLFGASDEEEDGDSPQNDKDFNLHDSDSELEKQTYRKLKRLVQKKSKKTKIKTRIR